MKDGPLWFPIIPPKDGAFAHHIEVGPFLTNFISPSVPGPFLRASKEIGRSRKLLDVFKYKIMKFTCVIFQVQDGNAYILGLDDIPMILTFLFSPFSKF